MRADGNSRCKIDSRPLLAFAKFALAFMICHIALMAGSLQGQQQADKNGLEIVSGYPLVREWLGKSEISAVPERKSLFKHIVITPILDKCFPKLTEDQAMENLEDTIGDPSDWDLAQVKRELAEMEAHSSELSMSIQSTFALAENKFRSAAPVTFCVLYLSPYWGPMRQQFNGSFGFTPSGTLIRLFVAPVGDWLRWMPDTVAHEYHHATWMQSKPGIAPSKFDLLETLVFEGRADQFARFVTGLKGPWTDALSVNQECSVFNAISPQLHAAKFSWFELNHSRSGKFPEWAGYTVGYRLVGAYLQTHPHVSVLDWTSLSPSALLKESGYSHRCSNSD